MGGSLSMHTRQIQKGIKLHSHNKVYVTDVFAVELVLSGEFVVIEYGGGVGGSGSGKLIPLLPPDRLWFKGRVLFGNDWTTTQLGLYSMDWERGGLVEPNSLHSSSSS
jgi:hypothetical protein